MATRATDIDGMDNREFEAFVADFWRRQDYQFKVTQAVADGGVDVIAENENERLAIEIKWRSDTNVGAPTIRELAGVIRPDRFDRGIVVTNTNYTSGGYEEVNQLPITLSDGDDIRQLDQKHRRQLTTEEPEQEETSATDAGLVALLLGSVWVAIETVLSDPEILLNLFRALLFLFVIYLGVDGFGTVFGYDLPGGV